uniref:AB hydrolase-1 domain-containing protein n=1 Tax=Alexandrium monilatum TaxID=311494 RepID=A0A7S4UF18_9DINO
MRVALAGPEEGPLVLLIHGWPDLWYGWRFQLPALAAAGYRVAAPDMRGFGGTDAPADASEYILPRIEEDVLGLLRAIRRDSCVLMGHDFGRKAVFGLGMRNPQVFPALVSVAVPYLGHKSTVSILEEWFGNPRDRDSNFSYILSHQLPEVAAAYDADVRECLRTIHGTIPGGDVDSPPKVVSHCWCCWEMRTHLSLCCSMASRVLPKEHGPFAQAPSRWRWCRARGTGSTRRRQRLSTGGSLPSWSPPVPDLLACVQGAVCLLPPEVDGAVG